MVEDRRLAVLRAIVEDYVATHEPVGSRSLVERHSLGVSPATIRNDMAALEEEGLIAQPHTSAGRVPTDQGYRVFVDRLSQVKPMSAAERRAIGSFLDGAVDLDDVMQRSVRLLAQLTRQVALIQYPSLTRSHVRHIELVGLGPSRVLLVLIADTGRVEQRVVETGVAMTDDLLGRLRGRILERVTGQRLVDVADRVSDLPEQFASDERPAVTAVVASLLETVVERHEERVMLAGTANLAKFGEDFTGTVRPVLEALEEQMVLLRLLGESRTTDVLSVRIGHENEVEGLSATSVVTVGYGLGDDVVAQLGVVGPTRMDYPGTMGSVRAVARYVGRILTEQQ
ncbi:heat-inducible transcriptional repressor HrcA [Longivirga aurantiaca]|uniref:Heat-inducible transcription repressor HrcA n=1 Tax=Longivirga aurantiaca TaxID=1837743 RepID=A0ABW1T3H3_9ACTN